MMQLSEVDRKILNHIQEDVPLVSKPFEFLADKIGISEDLLLEKIEEFKSNGVIRMYSAGLNHKKLEFKSTLIAVRVPAAKVEDIADYLAQHVEVTHCYLRDGEFNLWFVFLYREDSDLVRVLEKIEHEVGKGNILNLKTIKKFKLKTRLKI
jgi:DNA-binding Lrp family transcriptional regulator|tara:strand:- start:386 stop:841 length:456 start_codon:yes stop_codon:yes gene_type:complete